MRSVKKNIKKMEISQAETLGNFLQKWCQTFCAYHSGLSLEEARQEALLLVQKALNVPLLDALSMWSKPLSKIAEHKRLRTWAKRRLKGEPLSRLSGKRAFYKHEFFLTPNVLDPRPETELLVERALDFLERFKAPHVLELGVGSGCVLLSVLSELVEAYGYGTDVSLHALKVAQKNAHHLGCTHRIQWFQGSWFEPFMEKLFMEKCFIKKSLSFDLILSNPPYIESGHINVLDPAVKQYDPHIALDGGGDGLDAYRVILKNAHRFISPKGALMLEIGYNQKEAVRALATPFWSEIKDFKDLAGHPRVIVCTKPRFETS